MLIMDSVTMQTCQMAVRLGGCTLRRSGMDADDGGLAWVWPISPASKDETEQHGTAVHALADRRYHPAKW